MPSSSNLASTSNQRLNRPPIDGAAFANQRRIPLGPPPNAQAIRSARLKSWVQKQTSTTNLPGIPAFKRFTETRRSNKQKNKVALQHNESLLRHAMKGDLRVPGASNTNVQLTSFTNLHPEAGEDDDALESLSPGTPRTPMQTNSVRGSFQAARHARLSPRGSIRRMSGRCGSAEEHQAN